MNLPIKASLQTILISSALISGSALAVGSVQSDYANDINSGQNSLKTDSAGSTNANEVKSAENVEGDVDNGQVEVQEQVDASEATDNDSTSGSNSEN